ncbi:MAG: TlpA disulfide reductase family protein, partial [Acidobacteriota bacterium]
VAINGEEKVPFTTVDSVEDHFVLRLDGYDSEIVARLDAATGELRGEWSKTIPEGRSRLPFVARRGQSFRFEPPAGSEDAGGHRPQAAAAIGRTRTPAPEDPDPLSGAWDAVFTDEDGTEPARAEFSLDGTHLTGTFLTPTGDYRFLDGDFIDARLRLSAFDGGHVFLFHARLAEDGSLAGDFWSRDRYHATWTARRAAADDPAALADPAAAVNLVDGARTLRFDFPDLDGHRVASTDPRFAGKVVLVVLFGSWCPNCNDEAPALARWDRIYRDRGLAIVGLAYEFTGDVERDRTFVRKYARRHGIRFPLLLAGVSDKEAAGKTLPDLSRVAAYPTTIFIGRDGTVRHIHSGFAGPATGEHHTRLLARLQGWIEELLAERPGLS